MAHKDNVFEHYLANEAWWKMQKNVKIHLISIMAQCPDSDT
jgi:hypothetical protein